MKNEVSTERDNEYISLVSKKYKLDDATLAAVYTVPNKGTNFVLQFNKTDGEVREILLILAVGPSDCLELCVYDSGVPFPDSILERFGERGNTTTGTGNGLADTVNTLRTYDASIEIEAIDPGTDIYTKCVRICFDGKNEIHI